MDQKKNVKIWQMFILLGLAVVILTTMFLPAYRIDSDALKDGMENAQLEEDEKKDEDKKEDKDEKESKEKKEDKKENKEEKGDKKEKKEETDTKKDEDQFIKRFEKRIGDVEDKYGVDNETISPLKLMVSSLSDIRYNGKEDEEFTKSKMGDEIYDALNKKHRVTRIFLWMVYGLSLAVILVLILTYCMGANKYITLILGAVYGVYASAIFAFMRFWGITSVKEEVGELIEKFLGKGYVFKDINVDRSGIASSFISYAFLLGIIAAAAFFICSVVFMLVGNQTEEAYNDYVEQEPTDAWAQDWNQPQDQIYDLDTMPAQRYQEEFYPGDEAGADFFEENYKEPEEAELLGMQQSAKIIPPTEPVQEEPVQEEPKKTAPAMGKVRCTKGMTAGPSGYALPEDRKVVVGKSPHQANLVIVNNNHVSNIHCTIRYEVKTDAYIVRDHSSNGTYVNGVRLQKETPIKYPAGTVLALADGNVEITLG